MKQTFLVLSGSVRSELQNRQLTGNRRRAAKLEVRLDERLNNILTK